MEGVQAPRITIGSSPSWTASLSTRAWWVHRAAVEWVLLLPWSRGQSPCIVHARAEGELLCSSLGVSCSAVEQSGPMQDRCHPNSSTPHTQHHHTCNSSRATADPMGVKHILFRSTCSSSTMVPPLEAAVQSLGAAWPIPWGISMVTRPRSLYPFRCYVVGATNIVIFLMYHPLFLPTLMRVWLIRGHTRLIIKSRPILVPNSKGHQLLDHLSSPMSLSPEIFLSSLKMVYHRHPAQSVNPGASHHRGEWDRREQLSAVPLVKASHHPGPHRQRSTRLLRQHRQRPLTSTQSPLAKKRMYRHSIQRN